MTDARTNDLVSRAREDVQALVNFAYEMGFHEMGYAPEAVLFKEIERLTGIVERNKTSATHRLHNLCDGLAEDAAKSPFTREEWAAVDRQTVRLQSALRGLIDAVRNIEIDKPSWDAHIALPLGNSYRALKHEDPLPALDVPK
jgi:hypothetical protein